MSHIFIAEITKRSPGKPSFTPERTSERTLSEGGIYWLECGGPYKGADEYWASKFGGVDDTANFRLPQIRFNEWLVAVGSLGALITTNNSCYYTEGRLYINIPFHPWLYADHEISFGNKDCYLSAPKSAAEPDDMRLNGAYAEGRLEAPSVSTKLSDVISGLVFLDSFSITLDNRDGKFDGAAILELYNSPISIKMAKDELVSSEYGDFIPVREGLVENIKISKDKLTLNAADKFRSLDGDVCGVINAEDYPIGEGGEDAAAKTLPVVFGEVTAPLITIAYTESEATNEETGDTTITINAKYLAAEYVSNISEIYTEDGTIIPSFVWTFVLIGIFPPRIEWVKVTLWEIEENVISYNRSFIKYGKRDDWKEQPADDVLQKPKYAKFSGYLNNKLGEIVTWLAAKEDNTKYTYTAWDIFEAYVYINASPRLNIMFSGGDIKSAIKTVLQSDMAYLIQKNDGRLTLRKWGGSYFVHEIDAFRIMDYPEKDFSDAEKNYFSSCRIKAGYNYLTKEYDENYLYTERESYAVNKFLKTRVAEYETRLISREDEEGLARSLSERFLDIKETVRVSVMRDLSGFKLLDMVKFKPGLEVNDRKYSDVETWIIKEIDYANDKLVLEAL